MLHKLMKLLKWLALAAWLIVMLWLGAKLAQQNQDPVQLKLLIWQLPEASSGIVFGGTLLLGVTLGLLAFVPSYCMLKLRLRNSDKRLVKVQQTAPAAALPAKVD